MTRRSPRRVTRTRHRPGSTTRAASTIRTRIAERPGIAELYRAMQAADHAEMLGDARRALEIMEAVPEGPDGKPFWRPWRLRYLRQLVAFEEERPPWTTSRWILAQAASYLHPSTRPLNREALDLATQVRGGKEVLPGYDDVESACQVMDFDWVYRQLFLYDLGGLRAFLATGAAPDLVAGADHIHEWAEAPMGGYRVVEESGGLITLQDLATLETIEVLDLGSIVTGLPGDTFLGRVVPIEDGAMFEGEPLWVPAPVAEAVAGRPEDWVALLADGCREYGVAPTLDCDSASLPDDTIVVTKPDGPQVLSDIGGPVWREVAASVSPAERFVGGPDPVVDDAMTLVGLGLALADERIDGARLWHFVAAALVEPGVEEFLCQVVQPHEYDDFARLAAAVPGMAAVVCRRVVEGLRAAG